MNSSFHVMQNGVMRAVDHAEDSLPCQRNKIFDICTPLHKAGIMIEFCTSEIAKIRAFQGQAQAQGSDQLSGYSEQSSAGMWGLICDQPVHNLCDLRVTWQVGSLGV